jgi:putative chitinase
MSYFDFNFNETQLTQILPGIKDLNNWFTAFTDILPNFDITTVNRVAMFLAQSGHETGNYTVFEENLNYTAQGLVNTFPNYFKTNDPNNYAHDPEKIANLVYSNRMGNGDVNSGDGWKFRGRGALQLTGKENYSLCSNALYGDLRLLNTPEILISFEGAIASACWFWQKHNLNILCDSGNIKEVTLLVNGGYIGLPDREIRYNKALSILNSNNIGV